MKKILFTGWLLLLTSAPARAALPDAVLDPATREVLEYLDAKADRAINFITNFSTSTGGLSYPIAVNLGGTGANTAAGALAALGGVGFNGAGATGTWPINISGTVDKAYELYNTPGLCSAGQAFRGITVAGNPVGCFTPFSGTATSNLDMAGYDITNAGTVTASAFVGDGSGITGIPVGLWELIDGNLVPRDAVGTDISWEIIDGNIVPI